jgi:hypothetical protein
MIRTRNVIPGIAIAAVISAAITVAGISDRGGASMDVLAGRYVQLVEALGARDPDTLEVDGASARVRAQPTLTLPQIADEARQAIGALERMALSPSSRREHLISQLDAVAARAAWLSGARLRWPEELRRLFHIDEPVPETSTAARAALRELDRLLAGAGTTAEKLDVYDARFIVPTDRMSAVFTRALDECRQRARRNLRLPDGESVSIAFVQGQPWSGFSRYLGRNRSRIEVNTSFPLTIDRVLELACHEGYPGHHTLSVLRDIAVPHDWPERDVTPLFSPDGFVAEAAASWATDLVFTKAERLAFERDVLFPLAGLDPGQAAGYLVMMNDLARLRQPLGIAVSRYLAGDLDFAEAIWALQSDALMARPLATLQFANRYRGYALAYTVGRAELEPLFCEDVPVTARWENLRRLAAPE